jgi:hypothetical protein
VLDLPLCLGVLKHRAPLDFCLCDAILNLKAFCFGAIPDIMIELIVYVSCHKAGSHDSGSVA